MKVWPVVFPRDEVAIPGGGIHRAFLSHTHGGDPDYSRGSW